MQFLPFEEKGSNQELDNYLASVATPDSFGAQAWMAAVLFQQAVDEIVETDGPNAITRASLLEALNGIDSFDANGWMGAKDPKGGFSDCMVIMQMGADGFERIQPAEIGHARLQPVVPHHGHPRPGGRGAEDPVVAIERFGAGGRPPAPLCGGRHTGCLFRLRSCRNRNPTGGNE